MKKLHSVVLMFLALMPFCSIQAKSGDGYVVFLGDDRDNVIQQCKNSSICNPNHQNILITPNNTTATDRANLAYVAKYGVLVVDATVGPSATVREDILIARQVGLSRLSVWFSNTEQLFQELGKQEGQTLLNLEVEEVKNLLDAYDITEMVTKFYFGKSGLEELMIYSKSLPVMPKHQSSTRAKTLKTYVYNLTQLEQKYSKPLTNNMTATVWISGVANQAKIILNKDVDVGENSELCLQFKHSIQTKKGERFFIQINNHLVAAGVVAQILE